MTTKPKAADPPPRVAYLSTEIGIDPVLPTYAGVLGVLAGNTIRSALMSSRSYSLR